MRMIMMILVVAGTAFAGPAIAGDLTVDTAVGGAIGGAVGGIIGAELGGRNGAIVGAGLGAATGVAVNTREHDGHEYRDQQAGHYYDNDDSPYRHPHGRHFCPPGQAKKGRC